MNYYTYGPFLNKGLPLIPTRISNYILYNVWDDIAYPFQNPSGCTVDIWDLNSPHTLLDM